MGNWPDGFPATLGSLLFRFWDSVDGLAWVGYVSFPSCPTFCGLLRGLVETAWNFGFQHTR